MTRLGAEPIYGIGAVARMVGSSPAGLRAWEDRYGVVIPARSAGGQRLYSRDQVDQLHYVQNLVASGLHAAEAHRLLGLRLADGMTLVPLSSPDDTALESILLAERDVYTAELVEYLLRTEGYAVFVALDADDACKMYELHRPDLVFVELVISGGVGLRLCRQLCGAGARVVAVSSLELGAAAVDAGAEAFLHKPLDPLQVLSVVRDLIGTSRLVRSEAK